MTFLETFRVRALWQRRLETPEMIARRFQLYLAYAKAALPPDTHWYGWLEPDVCFDVDKDPAKLEPYIKAAVSCDDDGTPAPEFGYHASMMSFRGDPSEQNTSAVIRFGAGSGYGQNTFSLFTDSEFEDKTDPRLVTYHAMRTKMLATAFSFQPDWCEAGPTRLADYFDFRLYTRPPMGLAWMIWFNPKLAPLIEPPRYSYPIVERFGDGSLFLATSTETFDCRNTTRLEQARAIHRQIDPLNYTLPFDGRCGRSDRVPPFPRL